MRKVKEAFGLAIGEKVKDFSGIDQNGNAIQLSQLLKKGKVVIVFYRGQWCPICMPHIKKLQNSLDKIKERGASIILTSPENQENIQKTILKTNVSTPILYDKNYEIMKNFDVDFTPGKSLQFIYNNILKANLKNAQSDDSQTLPIPATYIIDNDGTIIWRQFNRDYKKRSKIKEIMDQL
ncbi:MAG: AhpC/TSA family protein [Flavobacteriaceae bacterium]|nr:AhpC/TSA family protein [Flavobacteriaceae bacterium]